MTSNEIAVRGARRSAIAMTADQTDWTPEQVAALRQLGLEDAPEGDLRVFHHVCQTTGLDPFRKQIYMIGRKTRVSYWDDQAKRKVEDWIMKYTIQTGIDGFRRNGREAAKRENSKVQTDGPYWQGEDGRGWQDVWLSNTPPAAAKFTIFRDGEAHVGIAMYREYVQTTPGKDEPNSMWKKMPANQIAKCAEAQAWRRAYPDDFSGVQLEDAVQVIDPNGSPVRATAERVHHSAASMFAVEAADIQDHPPLRDVVNREQEADNAAVAEAAHRASEAQVTSDSGAKPDTAQVTPSASPDAESPKRSRTTRKADKPAEPPRMTAEQSEAIGEHMKALRVKAEADQLDLASRILERPIKSVNEITEDEAATLVDELADARAAEQAKAEGGAE
ncbi:recombinase RecT [Nocardia sp. NPDC004711]